MARQAVRRRLALLVAVALAVAGCPNPGTATGPYRIVGYYTSWSIFAPQYFVTDIPAAQLTHINYAFINVSEDGGCIWGDEFADVQFLYPDDTGAEPVRGNVGQFRRLKRAYPHLKVLMSVGGWTWSDRFSDIALTPESRALFAQSCTAMMRTYGFDGIDIDWEFPVGGGLVPDAGRPEDKTNFTLLLAELRTRLEQQGMADSTHYLLTIAAPATAQFYQNIELDQVHRSLDWINLMTYTFHGGWSPITNLHAPLYPSSTDPSADDTVRLDFNVAAAVRAYLDAGVPADKLVVGVPFYGHGWSGVKNVNHGLYQEFSGLPAGTLGDGIYTFRDLQANYLDRYERYWHAEAQVPWLYSPDDEILISYEDADSLAAKTAFVRAQGLGGIMIWSLEQDNRDHTLLDAIDAGLYGSAD